MLILFIMFSVVWKYPLAQHSLLHKQSFLMFMDRTVGANHFCDVCVAREEDQFSEKHSFDKCSYEF